MAKRRQPRALVEKRMFVMPALPESLDIDGATAALLHCLAFLELSSDRGDLDAVRKVMEQIREYLGQLPPHQVTPMKKALARIVRYGKKHRFPNKVLNFLQTFSEDFRVGRAWAAAHPPMIPLKALPKDNEALAKVKVEFPRLKPDSARTCPQPLTDIVEYLRLESPDGDVIKPRHLRFLRTAAVGDHLYWIWSFKESDGTRCFVTVSIRDDLSILTGYDQNEHGLSPEQYMLGDYYQVF